MTSTCRVNAAAAYILRSMENRKTALEFLIPAVRSRFSSIDLRCFFVLLRRHPFRIRFFFCRSRGFFIFRVCSGHFYPRSFHFGVRVYIPRLFYAVYICSGHHIYTQSLLLHSRLFVIARDYFWLVDTYGPYPYHWHAVTIIHAVRGGTGVFDQSSRLFLRSPISRSAYLLLNYSTSYKHHM